MSTVKNRHTPVNEVMIKSDAFPVLSEKTLLKEALEGMDRFRLGIVCIVNERFQLLGILTDGDIRRKLLTVQKPFSAFLMDDALIHAIRSPITIRPSATLIEGVELMGKKQIWDLPVVDGEGLLIGLLHLHPAIRAVLEMGNDV